MGCKNARGFCSKLVSRLVEEFWRSIGGGWTEPVERVCEEMEASGENEGGAML